MSKNAKNSSEPKTMADLLQQEGVVLRGLHRGDVIEGVVTQISPRSLSLDIGAKTEGVVIDKEFSIARGYIRTLNVGQKIKVTVVVPENDSGQILLSLKSAAEQFNWQKIKEWKETDATIRVKVLEVNRGGAVVYVVDEIQGFIPTSQFNQEWQERLGELVNKEIEVKIMDYDKDESKVILSERNVSEAEDLEKRAKLLAILQKGEFYEGVVTRVVPFGIFVKLLVDPKDLKNLDISEIDLEGLVHISELSWEKINDPSEFAKIGDKVKVKVISSDSIISKLSLSIKQLEKDPWEGINENYPVDKQVVGSVVRVAPFGVFVELDKGIEGLIHISKLSIDREYKNGDKVDCYIESVDLEGRRISLGLVLTQIPMGYK